MGTASGPTPAERPREEVGLLERREPDGTPHEKLEVGRFQLVEEVLVPVVAVSPHETQGQAEIIDLPDLPLVKPQGVQPFEELFPGLGRMIIEALELLPLPVSFLTPGGAEDRLVHPGADSKPGQIIILLGNKALLETALALGEEARISALTCS